MPADAGHAARPESVNELFAQVAGVRNAAVRRHGRAYLPWDASPGAEPAPYFPGELTAPEAEVLPFIT